MLRVRCGVGAGERRRARRGAGLFAWGTGWLKGLRHLLMTRGESAFADELGLAASQAATELRDLHMTWLRAARSLAIHSAKPTGSG
jgi:hypothetical protein